MRNRINYINNKELHCELIVSKAQGRLTERAKNAIILICKGVNRKFWYKDGDDRLDCLSEAYLHCFRSWMNYDELKTTNPFAFFTEVAKRAHAKSFNGLMKYREEVSLNAFYKEDGDVNV